MANNKGPSSARNMMYNGKHSLLPPKSPFPSIPSSYTEYVPNNPPLGPPKSLPKAHHHHQRTSSESLLLEEQPSWLDDLLNEPETPVRRGHRRSSSDSFAYIDAAIAANIDYAVQDEYKIRNLQQQQQQQQQDFDRYKDATRHSSFYLEPNTLGATRHSSFYLEPNTLGARPKNRAWDSSLNSLVHPSGLLSARDNFVRQSNVLPGEQDHASSTASEKQDTTESGPPDAKSASEKKDLPCPKGAVSETDTKRAKQQFAQRSRVRKLQYIAELERNVQALQAEGSEVSAELEFLNQQNLILSMENNALKQRVENLAQEQLIKHLEHEVLEREIGRLRGLYQQQQQLQQQPTSSGHRRSNSKDQLESQFANLTLKQHKDNPTSARNPVTGPLHI